MYTDTLGTSLNVSLRSASFNNASFFSDNREKFQSWEYFQQCMISGFYREVAVLSTL